MESKLSKSAMILFGKDGGDIHLTDLIDQCTVAVAGNAGLAGMLPRAAAEWGVSIAIEVFNVVAEMREEMQKNS